MLRTIFILSILIPGIAVAIVNRYAALLLYVWFALFRPEEWLWWDISNLRVSLFLGLLLLIPSLLSGVLPNFTHSISLGAILFLIAAGVAQLNAPAPDVGWFWLDFLFRLIAVCLLAISLVSDQRRFKWFLFVVAASFGFHGAKAGLASLLGGGLRFAEGLSGAFTDNNGYAVGMVMIVPLLIAVAQSMDNRWVRLGFFLAAPLTAMAVVSTFSRGGFLGMAAAVATLAILQKRRVLAVMSVVVLAVPLAVFSMAQEGYLDRLQTIQTYEDTSETSALSRLHFWKVAVDMALDQPLGVGLFNYEAAYDKYDDLNGAFGRKRSVHSSHFQVLAETGWGGAAAYITLFVAAFRAAFRTRRRGLTRARSPAEGRLFVTAANAMIASMTGFLVGGAFIAMALNDLTWLTFAMVACLDRISASCCETTATELQSGATLSPALSWSR